MSDIPDDLRELVTRRAGNRCEYCHVPAEGQISWFPIDHIRPKSANGATESSNLAFACPRCNASKWAFVDGVDPSTGEIASLYDPRSQVWDKHFQWSAKNPLELEGKTAIGRATISRLKINDTGPLMIRRLLHELGIFKLSSSG